MINSLFTELQIRGMGRVGGGGGGGGGGEIDDNSKIIFLISPSKHML